jgi:hypothetical protein|tara:strand:+ start:416 stop:670 length:255 start_codon:yes stop_codon:yes gene_type:complete
MSYSGPVNKQAPPVSRMGSMRAKARLPKQSPTGAIQPGPNAPGFSPTRGGPMAKTDRTGVPMTQIFDDASQKYNGAQRSKKMTY